MKDLIMLLLCIASAVCVSLDYGFFWTIVLIITLLYLIIRGLIFFGFDIDDLF